MSSRQRLQLRMGAGYNDRSETFELPAGWHATVYPPRGADPLDEHGIDDAFRKTLGCAPISKTAKGAKSAVILVDDFRRPTPAETLCHRIIDDLEGAGVPGTDVCVVLGNGAHRVMDDAEVSRRLGTVTERVGRVISHDAFSADVSYLGVTACGTPVLINRAAAEADFSITVSTVYPHVLTGWGGGAKMVLPGVAHVSSSHYHHTTMTRGVWGGDPDTCIARADIEEAARMFGLTMSVCAVIGSEKQLCGLTVGEPTQAHRRAVDLARHAYHTDIDGPKPDLVIANSYPMDGDPTQTSKTEIPARRVSSPILMIVDFADPCDWHGVYHGPREPYLRRMENATYRADSAALDRTEIFVYCPKVGSGYIPANPSWYCDHDWERLMEVMTRRFPTAEVAVLPAAPLQIPVTSSPKEGS